MFETLDNFILSILLFIFYFCVFSYITYGGTNKLSSTENNHNIEEEINSNPYKQIFSSDFDPVVQDSLNAFTESTLTGEMPESLWLDSDDNLSQTPQELDCSEDTSESQYITTEEQNLITTDNTGEEISNTPLQLTETNVDQNNSDEVEVNSEITTGNIDFSLLKQKHLRGLCPSLGLIAKKDKKWLPTKTIRSMLQAKAEENIQAFITAVNNKYPDLLLTA